MTLRGQLSGQQNTRFLTDVVKRGNLEITVSERGSLDSASNVTLSSHVEGMTTIISIVPEGQQVEVGQVLVELDSASLRDQQIQQQIVLEQAEASYKQAVENMAIQRTQNESDIAAATLQLELAKLDLDKYEKGEYLQLLNELTGSIKLAEEKLTRAEEKYAFSKRLSKKGYVSQSELEADRIAVDEAEIALGVAKAKKDVLEKYTYKREIAEKRANAVEFERELERTRRKATAALTQFEADVSSRKLTAEVERSKMEKLRAQIAACRIQAPQAGEVVYANMTDRRGNQEVLIQEGTQVRERQAIINLPDYSQMQVNSRIHESRIGLIRPNLNVRVRVDASPGEVFHGIVQTVSTVPLSGSWPNRDLKEYAATIRLTDPIEKLKRLKPGLTAEVEIVVDQLTNVLYAPVQAVTEFGGKHVAFVISKNNKPEMRAVNVGRTNEVFVEILEEGSELQLGDSVVMNPASLLPDSPAEGEAESPESDTPNEEPAKSPGNKSPGNPVAESPQVASAGPAGGPPAGGPPRDPNAFFQMHDADKDGKLVQAELPERMQARFSSMDADGDGAISEAEWSAAASKFRRGGGSGGPREAAP